MKTILSGMEPEKFLTPTEFNTLLKAAKDDRARCILLLLAGAGLRVGEMTQIRAEDIDLSKGYLHVQAINAKFKKPRTVVLLPQVVGVLKKQLAGRSKGWLFRAIGKGISPPGRSKIFSMALPPEPVCRKSSARIRRGKIGIVFIRICSDIALPSGAWMVAYQSAISRTSLDMLLWLPREFISRPVPITGEKRI